MFDATVELLLDGVWTDVSEDVRQADGIQITRGRSGEASQADPASCSLTLNNRLGQFSPRNPVGVHYGTLGRNTQIRVSISSGARFYGEVSAWPQRWDKTGRDVWTPIQAAGVMRRLGQGSTALRSVLYRALTARDDVVGYWPCEDADGSTEFASGMSEHPPMRMFDGTASVASYDGFAASAPLPLMSNTAFTTGEIPKYSVTGLTQINFLLAIPAAGAPSTAAICHIRTSGSAQLWTVHVNTSGQLRLQAFNSEEIQIADSGFSSFNVNGKLLRVSVELDSTTADVDWALATLEVGQSTGLAITGTLTGRTIGRIRWLSINPRIGAIPILDDVAFGHVTVHNNITSIYGLSNELKAYTGERAANRITRLCGEEDVTIAIVGTASDTALMGPQTPTDLLDLLSEAAEADMGILYEPRDFFGLEYRTRASMYAQAAALTLDYTARTASGIEPTEDDDAIRNDVTVTRVNGSSARAQLGTGPLSVEDIGRYVEDVSISVERDGDLPDQASWRLHLGTVDEARYPVLGVNLANAAFTGDAALTAAAAGLDIGDRLVVTNAPALSTSPEDIQQIAQGFTETIGQYEWLIDVNCTPASPWDVAVWDDTTGPGEARYSSDGTTTTEALDTTETGVDVSTPTGPVWGTTDLPYDVMVGGERMTVTGVSGTSAAQTFTVTRSVNGVVKAHASGADVQLFKPAIYAL